MSIFIGGTGRCGTTILGGLFSHSPEVLYFSEPRFICDKYGLYHYVEERVELDQFSKTFHTIFLEKLIKGVSCNRKYGWNEFYSEEFINMAFDLCFTSEDRIANSRNFIDFLFSKGAREVSRSRWVEKTPNTVRKCYLLWKIFPKMLYIHVFRDPRSIYCSVRSRSWGPNNIDEFIPWYFSIVNDSLVSMKKIPRKNFILLNLNELVNNPVDIVKDLFRCAGLDISEENILRCSGFVDPSRANLNRWKNELSRREQAQLVGHCLPIYTTLCEHAKTNSDWRQSIE